MTSISIRDDITKARLAQVHIYIACVTAESVWNKYSPLSSSRYVLGARLLKHEINKHDPYTRTPNATDDRCVSDGVFYLLALIDGIPAFTEEVQNTLAVFLDNTAMKDNPVLSGITYEDLAPYITSVSLYANKIHKRANLSRIPPRDN